MAWRTLNFGLRKAIEKLEGILPQFDNAYLFCMSNCDFGMVSICQVCSIIVTIKSIADAAVVPLTFAVSLSELLYGEIVDGQDDAAAAEQDSAVYENVITIHGNVIQTFNQLSRVLTIVSGSPTGQSSRRRLQVIDCINTTLGEDVDNCSKPFCDKPEKLCDGRINYEYISQRKNGENHNRKL